MKKYTEEELEIIDRYFGSVVGLFNLLLKIDRMTNPDRYNKDYSNKKQIVIDVDGREITL
jgi:hypothetical protein